MWKFVKSYLRNNFMANEIIGFRFACQKKHKIHSRKNVPKVRPSCREISDEQLRHAQLNGQKMGNKFQEKDLFESDFDSFDLDDGFLLQVNIDLKKNSYNKTETSNISKSNPYEVRKSDCTENETKQITDKTAKCNDVPLFIEDLNESDFFDLSKTELNCSKGKVGNGDKDDKGRQLSTSNTLTNCPSPVFGSKQFHKNSLSSSTPLKPNDDSGSNENPKTNPKNFNNSIKTSQFDYLEADLFEDWGLDEIKKNSPEKDTVTFSQALKLIEEAESENQCTPTKATNQSIDMLTGEVVSADIHNLFDQSFDVLQPVRKHQDKDELSDDSISIIAEHRHKPPAAQKLNFDSKGGDYLNSDDKKGKEKTFGNICFSSDDDDFNFLTQDLLGKQKKKSKYGKPAQGVPNSKDKNTGSAAELNDSSVDVMIVKRRKRINVIESDTAEDSPSPKFRRQRKSKMRNRRIFQDSFMREFYDLEAEVSEVVEVSSDEVVEEDEYERSFLDEESYHTQNHSADMTAKYLQSVKDSKRSGTFKIPAAKPYNPEEVFSQALEENTDYQIDSFCVNDVEDDPKTEMSDLEVAERILEIDEKKRKKRFQKSRKFK